MVALALGFIGLALFERPAPRADAARDHRLFTNFALGVLNLAIASLLPLSTAAAARLAEMVQWQPLAALPVLAVAAVLLAARSAASYGLHRLTHAVPMLWRFHRVHHADRAFDLSTGWRHHPAEVLLATLVAGTTVFALGAPLWAVYLVDLALLVAALWEHADIAVPARFSRRIEWALVTPDFHRIHHSADRADHDLNFGGFTTLWDRLFGTYRRPGAPVARLGVDGEHGSADRLVAQLARPFHVA